MSAAVELHHISKAYGAVKAVRDVSLDIAPGELFGLIGPDGAGKTTLFRILTTLLLADTGTATVAGYDVVRDFRAIRNVVGYMPGKFSLYQDLTVQENLEFFAAVFRTTVRENYALVRDIYEQLAPFKDRRAGALSGGMKQKLALCCALIHKPEVLLLDEPTTGVDAVSRQEFWHMLGTLKAKGITIVVSTPYMDEAARCERVALLQEGQVLRVDTPAALRQSYPWPLYAVRAAHMYPLLQDLRAYPAAHSCYAFGEAAHLSLTHPNADAVAQPHRLPHPEGPRRGGRRARAGHHRRHVYGPACPAGRTPETTSASMTEQPIKNLAGAGPSAAPAGPVIKCEGLTKRFGTFVAVNAISFEVAPGEIFGFSGGQRGGQNHGYAHALRLLGPTEGAATVAGFDVLPPARAH